MITLSVNGRKVELEGPTSLLDYLHRLGVDERAVAVEVNGVILERQAYAVCTLQDGDRIEIVRMVGGGARPLASQLRPAASPSSTSAASASARSSQGRGPSATSMVRSCPLPASSTTSPGRASVRARRMAARRSSTTS